MKNILCGGIPIMQREHSIKSFLVIMFRFRAYDKKTSIKLQYKFYHWWIVDIQTGTNIDLTGEQYQRSHMLELHRIGEKNSMLGLSYEERVNILFKRVLQLL